MQYNTKVGVVYSVAGVKPFIIPDQLLARMAATPIQRMVSGAAGLFVLQHLQADRLYTASSLPYAQTDISLPTKTAPRSAKLNYYDTCIHNAFLGTNESSRPNVPRSV